MSGPADPRAAAWDPVDRVIVFVASRALLLGVTFGLAYLTTAVTRGESLTDPLIPGFGFGLVLVPPLAGALTVVVWLCASAAVRLARLSRVASLIGIGLCAIAETAIVGAGILSVMNVRPLTVTGAVLVAAGSAALLLRVPGGAGGRTRTAAP